MMHIFIYGHAPWNFTTHLHIDLLFKRFVMRWSKAINRNDLASNLSEEFAYVYNMVSFNNSIKIIFLKQIEKYPYNYYKCLICFHIYC